MSAVLLIISAALLAVGVMWIQAGTFGPFAYLWMSVALVLVLFHLFNLVRRRGMAHTWIDFDPREDGRIPADVEGRLRRLARLRDQGLISEAEYESKRQEVLREL